MGTDVRPITDDDLHRVGEFLQAHLNERVPVEAWGRAADPAWDPDRPNNGFMLLDDDEVVGAYLAVYSRRVIDDSVVRICNLGAWCVRPDKRFHSVKLLKALLAQPGFHFVDLSPSGAVIPLNERLGFRFLDTTTAVVPSVPWPWRSGDIVSDPATIATVLTGRERELYRDHVGAAAAHHVLLRRDTRWCYVVFRMDRRKQSPSVFASLLHVSDTDLFHEMLRPLSGYLLVRHRAVAILAEQRVVGRRPRGSLLLRSERRKMFRSPSLVPEQIDYFYSELVSVPW